ncbi:MAG: bifunctional methylenetetrahydrofolate dehydrogenase/methenyltetrahydrofolate cyclohydrolase FolD [Bacteroidales bacterium]|nr:bifunctional methylenetetrahydrofolate dehydrogenase/methenyltetrahydrofolate cyclohydrolase FolD [Bacteroidales bacterium]
MKLIDGKKIAAEIKLEIATEVTKMTDNGQNPPHLAAILVGDDPASQTYVRSKEKACQNSGLMSSVYRFPSDLKEEELLETIDFINNDPEIHGFIVQLPLPSHISENKIIEGILPEKDVDGFHPVNVGRMVMGLKTFLPATPAGIVELLKRSGIETEGKHCVVVGRSHTVGTPVSILLGRKKDPGNCTVTLCHSRTKNIAYYTRQADILIAAAGQKEIIKGDMVKKDVVVIDVGIHRIPSDKTKSGFKLVGDVDFEEVSKKASYITPVPGGVGPMTIASLLQNTLKAAKREVYP